MNKQNQHKNKTSGEKVSTNAKTAEGAGNESAARVGARTTPNPNPATRYAAGARAESVGRAGRQKRLVMVALVVVAVLAVTAGVVAVWLILHPGEKAKTDAHEAVSVATADNLINLTEKTGDFYIKEAGEYTITGTLEGHGVVVDVDAEVTLILKDVTIEATAGAAIASVNTGENAALNLILADETENNLADGGRSDYDAAIYSAGSLTINGNTGVLNVEGRQEEGEGIATDSADLTIDGGIINVSAMDDGLNAGGDGGAITINGGTLTVKAGGDGIDSNRNIVMNGGTVYVTGSSAGGDAAIDADQGYVVHGGTLVALGSDMLEAPGADSTQFVVAMTLGEEYAAGVEVGLVKGGSTAAGASGSDGSSADSGADGGAVSARGGAPGSSGSSGAGSSLLTYTAPDSFRTLVVSTPNLAAGEYSLKIDGRTVQTFNISEKVTIVGNIGVPGGIIK